MRPDAVDNEDMPASVATRTSPHRVLASSSRVEILHLLQRAGGPLGVDDLARLTGRHVNTTREHLERLRGAGYVERSTERRHTRGRPRILYTAVDREGGAALDERLREHLVRTALEGYGRYMGDVRQVAEEAGRQFVRENADAHAAAAHADDRARETDDDRAPGPPPRPVASPLDQALRQVAVLEAHLEEMRMSPEADLPAWQVHLRSCPFLDLARQRTEVVCSVHLGVLRGVLEKEGGPVSAARLVPFVGPQHCRVDLVVDDDGEDGSGPSG